MANDLMVHQKKLGGILCESDGHIVRIGVGINVNSTPADYSEEIRPLVTSTLRELGHEIPLESLIATCLDCFEATRTLYDNEGSAALIAQWNQLTFPRGTNIFVHEDQKSFEAKYQGLSPDGFLLVQVNDRIEKIISGTITLN